MKKIFIILLLFISLTLSATTYYIDPSGTDGPSHTGLIDDPWLHLWYACTRVSGAGDIIHINTGSYVEGTQMTLPYQVSLEGIGDNSHIISHFAHSGNYEALILCGGGSVSYPQTLSYFQLDGDALVGYQGIASYMKDYVYVHHCKIIDLRFMGVLFGGAGSNNNKFYSNISINCAGGVGYGFGDEGMALKMANQTDFLCYSNNISQVDRGTNYNGNGIGGYEASYNAKIYNNTITWVSRKNIYFFFAVELWLQQGLEMYGNTIEGEVDLGKDVNYGSYSYGIYFHDNILQWGSVQAEHTIGLQFEQTAEGVIVCNNMFKNIDCPIMFCQYKYTDDFVEDVWIYSNILYNCGLSVASSGWGIYFQSGSNADDEYPPQYYNNINIWQNTIVAYSAHPGARGIELPAHATSTSNMYIDVRNNIIVGFSVAGITARQTDNDYSPAIGYMDIFDNLLYGNGNSNDSYFPSVTLTNYSYDTHIKSDPLFKSSPTDLHLEDESPAYHAGTALTFPYSLGDYDHVSWASPNPTIGGYELITGGEPPVYKKVRYGGKFGIYQGKIGKYYQ